MNVPIVENSAREHQDKVINLLRIQPNFAVRLGEMSFQGWVPVPEKLAEVITTKRAFTKDDFKPDLKQKGVDLRIGIDTALLAKDHLVQRLVLVATDSDLVPAMKLARREGVQIVLADLGAPVKPLLREHADLYRRPVF